jgi:LysM repeat protein
MCRFFQNSREFRRQLWLAILLSAPLIFSSCKSTGGGSYRDVNYDPATLKTPSGHGLEKKEYPFDDDGRYRKDWVRDNTSGRTKTSYPGQQVTMESSEATVASSGATTDAYPTYKELSSSGGASTPAIAETESSSSPATQYHKVTSGDTLFGLAARYNTSVADLKRVNGLSGDSIRVGQSLRVP